MKNIGKPCAGELHARFDEGGQARACSLLYHVNCNRHVDEIAEKLMRETADMLEIGFARLLP